MLNPDTWSLWLVNGIHGWVTRPLDVGARERRARVVAFTLLSGAAALAGVAATLIWGPPA